MKKLFLCIAVAMMSLTAAAQYEYSYDDNNYYTHRRVKNRGNGLSQGDISLAPKAGLNFASLTSVDDTKMRIAFVGGLEGMYMATDYVGVSAGVFYSGQGLDYDISSGNAYLSLAYLNIPIMANFYVAEGFALKVGVQPGILLSAEKKYSESSGSATVDMKDNLESLDISIPVGLSYEFSNFIIEGKYNLGLTKVSKSKSESDCKNSVFQLTVGYLFVW